MRLTTVAFGVAMLGGLPAAAQAQSTVQVAQVQRDDGVVARRPRARIRIYRDDDTRGVYPRYNPGPNAVRDCTATYVQEHRPSGTVIVPRTNCVWRPG